MKARKLLFVLLLSTALMVVGVVSAYSEESPAAPIPVDQVHVSTPAYTRGPNFEPPLGTYDYSVSWQGIPAASASITVTKEGDNYRVVSSAKTARGIDIFYRLRYRAEGLINAQKLTPLRSVIDHQENSRIKNTQMTFKQNGEIESVRSQVGKSSTITRFVPDNFTVDPISAAFLARSLEWKENASYEFDTFNGKVRYLITLTAQKKSTLEFDGEEREVWVIVPKVINLSTPKAAKKLREAQIYLSADEKREVLKIRSSVFIGSVNTELESFTPANNNGVIHMAAHAALKEPG